VTNLFPRPLRRGLPLILTAGFAVSMAAATAGASPPSRKMERQLAIFERIVDEMLVDSPNFLVQGHDNTRGTYVDGQGALFVFKTSLVGGGWDDNHDWWGFWSGSRHHKYRDDEDADDDKDWRDRSLAQQKRRYERGKAELLDTIVDYADMLSTLGDTETLEIEARLRTADYFDEADLRRLTVTVKMSDVRAYVDGHLEEDALRSRIAMKES